jgi:signal peptidase I
MNIEKKIISKKIRPTIVRTQNITEELLFIAKSYNTKVELLDFNILETQTYTRILEDNNIEINWEEYCSDVLYDLENRKTLLNKDFEIKQIYKVEIFSKKTDDEFKDFKFTLSANKTKCKIYFKIASGSKIKYYEQLETDLKALINKSKIRAEILINIFDKIQENYLNKLIAYIKRNEEVVYQDEQIIIVAIGYEPIVTINDKLIFHFKDKPKTEEDQKIDYASRGFIHSAEKDEILIEYIKPQNGKSGRNCRGKYIDYGDAIQYNEPRFTVEESIKTIETSKKILYKAAYAGYILCKYNIYSIEEEMEIGKIDFKTTGHIDAGIDSKVTLNVLERDVQQDAIGNGMHVEATNIDIKGNVGANAVVTAKKSTIAGQTHKTALLYVEDLRVVIHRGTAKGKKIFINELEHGIVHGESVEIQKAVGGEIRAKDIKINVCISNVRAIASRRIEIRKLQGDENIFTIDPLLQKTINKDFEKNENEIDELENEIDKLKKDITKYTQQVENNISAFNEIKKKLANYKRQGIKMPNLLVSKYKQFVQDQAHLKSIKETHSKKEDRYILLTTKTASFQDNIFHARIINKDKWTGNNKLIFKLVDPPMEVSFQPKEGSSDKIFAIVEYAEGMFRIKAVRE